MMKALCVMQSVFLDIKQYTSVPNILTFVPNTNIMILKYKSIRQRGINNEKAKYYEFG